MAVSAATTAGHIGPAHDQGGLTKRDFPALLTASTAAVGVGAIAWPFIDSMNSSQDVLALCAKPIFVRHRTPTKIEAAEDVPLNLYLPPYAFATDNNVLIG
jgi:ubiquinol-cytochrome c reductase iron-sulfur subunit